MSIVKVDTEDGYLKAIKKISKMPLRLADHLFCKMTHSRNLKGMFWISIDLLKGGRNIEWTLFDIKKRVRVHML
jgi:hypothetical protein